MSKSKIIASSYVLGGAALILVGLYLGFFAPADFRSTQYLFSVEPGLSVSSTVDQLVKDGFLRSSIGGKIAFRLTGVNTLRAGTYNISPRMNAWQVAAIVREGTTAGAKITIPEGFTVSQIYQRLESNQVASTRDLESAASSLDLSKYSFLPPANTKVRNRLEGYLFPDTYGFNRGMPANQILDRLLSNFGSRTKELLTGTLPAKLSPAQVITLASLVEKEAKTDADRKLIAGVLENRLQAGMRLDVDATVRYAVDNWNQPLTQVQLDTNSPYNTRNHNGLPPGPICNPGLAAIDAVIHPTPNDYIYYLTGTDGVTHYAKTLDEHNRNKAQYLK